MKMRYLVLAMIGAMALSLGAVACGSDDDDGDGNGGGELTLAEYFSELETLGQAFANDLDALDEEAGEAFEGTNADEEAREVFIDFVGELRSATDEFVSGIDDLSPPAETADAHSEAVTAGEEVVDMFDNALTVLDTAETFEEAALILEGPGIVAASDRFSAACVALQDVADSNGFDINMDCPPTS